MSNIHEWFTDEETILIKNLLVAVTNAVPETGPTTADQWRQVNPDPANLYIVGEPTADSVRYQFVHIPDTRIEATRLPNGNVDARAICATPEGDQRLF